MPELRKQLVIENHVLLVCPHCWSEQQLAREYPELAAYPRSSHVCELHFELLLASAFQTAQFYAPPGNGSSERSRAGKNLHSH